MCVHSNGRRSFRARLGRFLSGESKEEVRESEKERESESEKVNRRVEIETRKSEIKTSCPKGLPSCKRTTRARERER